jgi:hypothetical protein
MMTSRNIVYINTSLRGCQQGFRRSFQDGLREPSRDELPQAREEVCVDTPVTLIYNRNMENQIKLVLSEKLSIYVRQRADCYGCPRGSERTDWKYRLRQQTQ